MSSKKAKTEKKVNLSGLIHKRLIVTFLGIFLFTGLITFFTEGHKGRTETKLTIEQGIADVENNLESPLYDRLTKASWDVLYRTDGPNILDTTIDDMEDVNKDGVVDTEDVSDFLYTLCLEIGVSEINLIDENGVIAYSSKPEYVGFDMINGGEQSKSFYESIVGTVRVNWFGQGITEISYDEDVVMFYIGMYYQKGTGLVGDGWVVQIGYDEETASTYYRNDVYGVVSSHRVGETGDIMAIERVMFSGEDYYRYYVITKSGHTVTGDPIDSSEDNDYGIEKNKPDTLYSIDYEGEPAYALYKAKYDTFLVGVLPKKEAMYEAIFITIYMIIMELVLFALLYVIISVFLHREIVSEIKEICNSLGRISKGELDTRAEVRNTYEFNKLSDDINTTVDTLKRYIKEAETRIDQELAFARAIQYSVLPNEFPAFPDRKDFDIYASMTPAKEVGGDFYDFFLLDEDHMALLIADVSGKGIPAAMFMMNAKALINSRAKQGGTPAEILTDVNSRLNEQNDNDFFVTVWFAIIELSTGRGLSANAGHEHPVFRVGDGKYELIKYNHNPPVASFATINFKDREFTLNDGDAIFVYTDGVTEATDAEGGMFGEERLVDVLNECDEADDMEQVVKNVKAKIDSFVGEAEQFDDITMLSFIYKGQKK